MKHYKKETVPAKIKKVLQKVTCDFCGKDIEHKPYHVDEIKIERITGYNYPEGGSGIKLYVDMCSECFESKLKVWVESQNVSFTEEEWEY